MLFCLLTTADSVVSISVYHDVASVGDGGVDGPQTHLVSHQVDVGGAAPAVREGVVVARSTQTALEQDAAGAEVVLHLTHRQHFGEHSDRCHSNASKATI